MKKLVIITTAIIALACKDYTDMYTLEEVLSKGWVKVKINSLGKFQNESATMEIKNISNKNLVVNIEAGRRLKASEDPFQDLLIVKNEMLAVNAHSVKKATINGFCCESSDRCPKNNLVYSVNTMADTSLVKVAQYISTNFSFVSSGSVQQAIWAISNNHPSAAISVKNEKEISLKYMVCKLKNEPIPWYVIKQRIFNLPNGRIYCCNDTLEGKFTYSNDKWSYTSLNVYNEKDNAMLITIKSWLPPGTNNNYELTLPVKSLPKGKYRIRLENEERIYREKEIMI